MPTPDDILTVTDLILLQSNGTKIRQRCSRTIIDSPNGASPSITYLQQEVIEINGVQKAENGLPAIVLPFDRIATQMHELTDPVTGLVHRVSAAFIGQWIRAHYVYRTSNPLPPLPEEG
jgi:hypothetical protein